MNLSTFRTRANQLLQSQLFWIKVCGIGIWVLIFLKIFGGEFTTQRVYVVDGDIDAYIRGTVDANVSGSVEIDNTVPVEVENLVRVIPL